MIVGLILELFACSGGVQSGSSFSSFSGVGSATVLSPTAVKLNWTKNSTAKSYKIYQNGNPSPIGETALDFFVVEPLNPDTTYTFKVVGVDGTDIYGSDKDIKATTWPRFTGITSARADALGNIELKWNYSFTPQKFLVFYRKNSAPDATSTTNWTVHNAESTTNSVTITGLDNSSTYYFIVHALYRENEKEVTTPVISLNTGTTFSAPSYSISQVSIGNVPTVLVDPTEDTTHGENFFRTTVLWNGNAVSDPLVGKGQIVLSSNANLPLGKIENLSLKVDYADGNRTESMTIDGLVTYIKGIPNTIEKPAEASITLGSSYMGKVLARGDFNCDGQDDLAVGLPDMSVASIGVKDVNAGAVIVYYSKEISPGVYQLNTSGTPSAGPVNPVVFGPQLITFDDLRHSDRFGTALSSGNFNGDKVGQNPCDDLIVGAPGNQNTFIGLNGSFNGDSGSAFMFFGSSKGLSSASHISDIASNSSTCDGSLSNAICSPVKLYENTYTVPPGLTGSQQLVKSYVGGSNNNDNFGFSVSFIGDFNADGFDDIAVGAPNADFDGKLSNLPTESGLITDTGAVFIFFGSKFGLGFEYPSADAVPNPSIHPRTRYIKIYAPIPQSGAQFGYSVHGGADVDGGYKVKYSSTPDTFYGGSDLIVGAPYFKYDDYLNNNMLARAPYSVGNNATANTVLSAPGGQSNWWDVNSVPLSAGTNYYGFPQSSTSVGAAFLYFGRAAPNSTSGVESPTRQDFWKCGRRGMPVQQHFSCLFDNTNVKMLTPRKTATMTSPVIRGFGSAVALVGSKSRYKENSVSEILTDPPPPSEANQYFTDTNEDGYADVVVSAPNSTVAGKTNVGLIQVYYGNPFKLFNPFEFFNIDAPAFDTGDNSTTCSVFNSTANPVKQACKPVIISSSSLATNTLLGRSQSEIAVGDVTGDGLLDVGLGAAGDNVIGVGSGSGLVFTSIKNQGLSPTYKKIYSISADAYDNLGRSIVIGNFNGDKNSDQFAKGKATPPYTYFPYGDLFLGAPFDEIQRPGGGGVYGFMTTNTSLPSIISNHNLVITETLASFSEYGLGDTQLVGDINNDGFIDAVSKLSRFNQFGQKTYDAVIYFGSAAGLITTSFCLDNQMTIFGNVSSSANCYPNENPVQGITLNDIALPQKIIQPSNLDPTWAMLPVNAGDVNGDGFSDVLFIPPSYATTRYSALFFGSRTGLLNVVDPSWIPASGDPQIFSQQITGQTSTGDYTYNARSSYNRLPYISTDLNKDGYSDIVVGLPYASSRPMNVTGSIPPEPTDLVGATPQGFPNGWWCSGTATLAECDAGSGIQHFGSIRVVYGSSRGYQTPRVNGQIGDLDRNGTNNLEGTEVSPTKPCDDSSISNTDPTCKYSYFDNPMFENLDFGFSKLEGQAFGHSITSADMNNDGFPDILVGTPGYEDVGCHGIGQPSNYGRVYIFYGSEYGLLAANNRDYYTPDLTAGCPVSFNNDNSLKGVGGKLRALMPSIVDYGNGSNNTTRNFGFSISSAGDVNNDGYDDVVISTPYEGSSSLNEMGYHYLYYGPLCPADNHDQITGEFQTIANLNTQRFYKGQIPPLISSIYESNVTIADTSITNSCFRGATSQMKPMPQKFFVLGAEALHRWGVSQFPAQKGKGDFNKDGFDDVIVGTPFYDDTVRGLNNVGQGVIFFGGEYGLYTADYPAPTVVTTATGQLRPYSIIPQGFGDDSRFFEKMGSTGDINGDGTMDILVPSVYYNGVAPFNGVNIGTFLIFN